MGFTRDAQYIQVIKGNIRDIDILVITTGGHFIDAVKDFSKGSQFLHCNTSMVLIREIRLSPPGALYFP
jgi:hypothetical protein